MLVISRYVWIVKKNYVSLQRMQAKHLMGLLSYLCSIFLVYRMASVLSNVSSQRKSFSFELKALKYLRLAFRNTKESE